MLNIFISKVTFFFRTKIPAVLNPFGIPNLWFGTNSTQ